MTLCAAHAPPPHSLQRPGPADVDRRVPQVPRHPVLEAAAGRRPPDQRRGRSRRRRPSHRRDCRQARQGALLPSYTRTRPRPARSANRSNPNCKSKPHRFAGIWTGPATSWTCDGRARAPASRTPCGAACGARAPATWPLHTVQSPSIACPPPSRPRASLSIPWQPTQRTAARRAHARRQRPSPHRPPRMHGP